MDALMRLATTGAGPYVLFGVAVVALLVLDLAVFHRDSRVMGVREALWWVAGWVSLAMAFAVGVYAWAGPQATVEFLAAYVIEESLSVDNLFVFMLVFSALGVGLIDQRKVLFWGILGAIVMRAAFILGGVALIERFHWVVYIFGAILVFSAIKMWRSEEGVDVDPAHNPLVKLAQRVFPVDCAYKGHHFTTRVKGALMLTPLAIALVAVESADLVFAIDSVPAALAVSRDPFIVFTSNIFAILGLRSLYFAVAGCVERFRYLHYGLALVLGFVGVKMLATDFVHVPISVSLAVVAVTVAGTVALSLWKTRGGEVCDVPVIAPATADEDA